MAVRYRYVGDGQYLPGIPARDLTDEDVAALDDARRAEVAAAAIYEAAKASGAAKQAAASVQPDGSEEGSP